MCEEGRCTVQFQNLPSLSHNFLTFNFTRFSALCKKVSSNFPYVVS